MLREVKNYEKWQDKVPPKLLVSKESELSQDGLKKETSTPEILGSSIKQTSGEAAKTTIKSKGQGQSI